MHGFHPLNRGSSRPTTVIGGTGFLGRRIVARLVEDGRHVRVAVRHPGRARSIFPAECQRWIETARVDVGDRDSVASSLAGSRAVINAVSAYVEKKGVSYEGVHERGAQIVAECARHCGANILVHISGIGADPDSRSRYIRSRGRGERLVRRSFGEAQIVRPSVMFGPDDAFLSGLAAAARAVPVLPVFGARTLLQPVHVTDVAEAVCRIADQGDTEGRIFELGGPRIYPFRALIGLVAPAGRGGPVQIPVPIRLARLCAWALERLPNPPLTVAQVDLLAHDNVASRAAPGFSQLGIVPTALEPFLRTRLKIAVERPHRAEG